MSHRLLAPGRCLSDALSDAWDWVQVFSTWKLPSQLDPCHPKPMLLIPELRLSACLLWPPRHTQHSPAGALWPTSGVFWYPIKNFTSSPDQPVSSPSIPAVFHVSHRGSCLHTPTRSPHACCSWLLGRSALSTSMSAHLLHCGSWELE